MNVLSLRDGSASRGIVTVVVTFFVSLVKRLCLLFTEIVPELELLVVECGGAPAAGDVAAKILPGGQA